MIFDAKWIETEEVAQMQARQLAFAVDAVADQYWPSVPLHVAQALVPLAMEYWSIGPATAAYELTEPAMREAIVAAYNSDKRGNGVFLIRDERGAGYRTAYACTRRNFSKLTIAGARWLPWPVEPEETLQ